MIILLLQHLLQPYIKASSPIAVYLLSQDLGDYSAEFTEKVSSCQVNCSISMAQLAGMWTFLCRLLTERYDVLGFTFLGAIDELVATAFTHKFGFSLLSQVLLTCC